MAGMGQSDRIDEDYRYIAAYSPYDQRRSAWTTRRSWLLPA